MLEHDGQECSVCDIEVTGSNPGWVRMEMHNPYKSDLNKQVVWNSDAVN